MKIKSPYVLHLMNIKRALEKMNTSKSRKILDALSEFANESDESDIDLWSKLKSVVNELIDLLQIPGLDKISIITQTEFERIIHALECILDDDSFDNNKAIIVCGIYGILSNFDDIDEIVQISKKAI